ncbi:MAG: DedA family protein [bacterium]
MMQDFVLSFILLFSSYAYIGVFLLLILSGCGFPLPEEITLLAAGFLTSQEIAHFIPMFLFCMVAVFISDMIPYITGYFYGQRIFRIRYIRNFATPKRIRKVSRFFRIYGYKKVFVLRPLLLGIRPFIMLFSGVSGLKIKKFVPYQMAGEVIGVFLWMGLGRVLAEHMAVVTVFFYRSRDVAAVFFAIIIALYLFNRFVLKKIIKPAFIIKMASVIFSVILLIILGYEVFLYRNKIKVFLKKRPAVEIRTGIEGK